MKIMVTLAATLAFAVSLRADAIFVANAGTSSISKFDESAKRTPFTNSTITAPNGVAADASGNIYVSTSDNRIEKFAPDGTDLGEFASSFLDLSEETGSTETYQHEIWLAIRSDGHIGSGTAADPFDGSTQARFDAVMASLGDSTLVHLGAGEFQTGGTTAWQLKNSMKLIGAGMYLTTVKMEAMPADNQQYGVISTLNLTTEGVDCQFYNFTVDCNFGPLYAALESSLGHEPTNVSIYGVAARSGLMQNVRAINAGGINETFVLSFDAFGPVDNGATAPARCEIDSCRVEQPDPLHHNLTCITCNAGYFEKWIIPAEDKIAHAGTAIIHNCTVDGGTTPAPTSGVNIGLQMGGFTTGLVENNTVTGATYGYYHDTFPQNNLTIVNNTFTRCGAGIVFNGGGTNLTSHGRISGNSMWLYDTAFCLSEASDILVESNTVRPVAGWTLVSYGGYLIFQQPTNPAKNRSNYYLNNRYDHQYVNAIWNAAAVPGLQGNRYLDDSTIPKAPDNDQPLSDAAYGSAALNLPMALAFDASGRLYVANFGGNTVELFSAGGADLGVFANVVHPTGLAFDSLGNLYVSNYGNTIERFDPTGKYLGTFASTGLSSPQGVAFDSLGNLYAANNGANTIQKFSPTGQNLGVFSQIGLNAPVGLAFDSLGNLYASNAQAATIRKIAPEGTSTLFASTGANPAFLAVQKAPSLANISTRGRVLTGDGILDAGFILTGAGTKTLLIRGLGPSLAQQGVSGTLADPVLQLHSAASNAVIASNDDWKMTQSAAIEATGIPPANNAEAALILSLSAGFYTVSESGKNGATGVGLIEIYDLTPDFGPALANISTRGFVDTGDDVMIAGFIVASSTGGSGSVIVRALGPSLGRSGLANSLANPTLELRDSNGAVLADNDDWKSDQKPQIVATGIAPTNNLESAIVVTLTPGAYTAIVSGTDGGTGIGLVEVYNLN